MATVLHRTTLELRESVHTPDYDPADWIVSPDLSAVAGLPRRYWKVVGDDVLPMDAAEMAARDAELADLAAAVDATTVLFTARGVVHDEWLGLGVAGRSDQTAWVAHGNLVLSIIGWSNDVAADADVVVHLDDAAVLSWSLTGTVRAVRTENVATVAPVRGQRLGVRVTATSTNRPHDVAVWLTFREIARVRATSVW